LISLKPEGVSSHSKVLCLWNPAIGDSMRALDYERAVGKILRVMSQSPPIRNTVHPNTKKRYNSTCASTNTILISQEEPFQKEWNNIAKAIPYIGFFGRGNAFSFEEQSHLGTRIGSENSVDDCFITSPEELNNIHSLVIVSVRSEVT
tara:strand:+ start:647 stop:1090 length:444 start_codon:yes stop_codon:yes gene_type:complete